MRIVRFSRSARHKQSCFWNSAPCRRAIFFWELDRLRTLSSSQGDTGGKFSAWRRSQGVERPVGKKGSKKRAHLVAERHRELLGSSSLTIAVMGWPGISEDEGWIGCSSGTESEDVVEEPPLLCSGSVEDDSSWAVVDPLRLREAGTESRGAEGKEFPAAGRDETGAVTGGEQDKTQNEGRNSMQPPCDGQEWEQDRKQRDKKDHVEERWIPHGEPGQEANGRGGGGEEDQHESEAGLREGCPTECHEEKEVVQSDDEARSVDDAILIITADSLRDDEDGRETVGPCQPRGRIEEGGGFSRADLEVEEMEEGGVQVDWQQDRVQGCGAPARTRTCAAAAPPAPSGIRWMLQALPLWLMLGLAWRLFAEIRRLRAEVKRAAAMALDTRRCLREARASALRFCAREKALMGQLAAFKRAAVGAAPPSVFFARLVYPNYF